MNVTLKPWSRRLALALPMIALLAGCDAGKDTDKEVAKEEAKPHAVATYVSAPWEALPVVSDSDLLAGFESWRSACQRLKADPVWGTTCAAAASVPGDAVAVRGFLKELREEGRCVIFSSHIMQEVAALCDRIVIVAQGRVVAQGTPDELREQAHEANLEDAFVKLIGSEEGLHA